MNKSILLACAHSGILFAVLLGAGAFFIPGWLPPVDPSLSADQIAAMFEDDRMRIRLGATVAAFGSIFYCSFTSVIAVQTRRIEGESHPLTYIQLASIASTCVVIWLAAYLWLAAAYRPTTPPETIQIFNDLAWLMFIGGFQPAFIQWLAIAFSILSDKRDVPIYPRWIGYWTIWITLTTFVGAFLPYFYSGPFAWNGVFGFWLAATMFFGWIIMMWWATVRAIKRTADTDQR
jgi:hypothetical protein